MKRFAFALLFIAASANAQVLATTPRGIAVAHDGRLEMFDSETQHRTWSIAAVAQPSKVVAGDDRVAVIESMANAVRIADVSSGSGALLPTGETPIDALFVGSNLFLLERDARALERIGGDGARASVTVAADPAFLRQSNGSLYVYSRLDGIVQEIAPDSMRVLRRVQLAPAASDFETDGRTGYLVYPRDGKLRTFHLKSMTAGGEIAAGAVPVDLAVTRGSNAMSAPRLAVADPSAKRVWNLEGSQSLGAAVTRGFLRGLLGLGLSAPGNTDFPTGVDRVVSSSVAFDSSTGTLYRIHKSKGSILARGLTPDGFTLTPDGVAVWQHNALRMIRF